MSVFLRSSQRQRLFIYFSSLSQYDKTGSYALHCWTNAFPLIGLRCLGADSAMLFWITISDLIPVLIKAPIMASLGSSMPWSRGFAPRLLKDFSTCRQCLRSQNHATKFTFHRQFTGLSFAQSSRRGDGFTALNARAKQLFQYNLRRQSSSSRITNAAEEGALKGKSSFPQVSDKSVAYWLLGSAVSVFGIVVFGGLTRLTESGCVGCI